MKNKSSPLMLAIKNNNKEIFDYLIDKNNLDIDACNND
jgi:ankyrin repeat protein